MEGKWRIEAVKNVVDGGQIFVTYKEGYKNYRSVKKAARREFKNGREGFVFRCRVVYEHEGVKWTEYGTFYPSGDVWWSKAFDNLEKKPPK